MFCHPGHQAIALEQLKLKTADCNSFVHGDHYIFILELLDHKEQVHFQWNSAIHPEYGTFFYS